MVGDALPNDLDLISLAKTERNRIYVIVEGGQGQGVEPTGPPVIPTVPTVPTRPPLRDPGSVTFTSGRSYLRLSQWSPGRRGRIEFNFRTIQRHGVMMVTSPSSGRPDFFAVELSDGDLYALFNLGGQTQRFANSVVFCEVLSCLRLPVKYPPIIIIMLHAPSGAPLLRHCSKLHSHKLCAGRGPTTAPDSVVW